MSSYVWPVPVSSPISQYFAANPYSPVQPQGHTGMDFAIPVGTPVYAIGAGTVLWADWATKLAPNNQWYIAPAYAGIVVLIDHGNIISVYAHLNETALNTGNKVTAGQVIAKSGNTGLSTGPHMHFEIMPKPIPARVDWLAGRANPLNYISKTTVQSTAPALAPNQRKVGPSNLNQRAEAKTSSKVVRTIQANTVETFSGYVYGEMINTGGVHTNLWYKDSQGYVWSGGFTEQKEAGLTNQTPVVLKANQRMVGPAGAIQRSAPDRSAGSLRDIKGNTVETFTGYVHGEKVTSGGVTSDIWYKDSLGYVWAGGFTSQSTSGLTNQTPPSGARTSGAAQVAYRKAPRLNAEVDRYLPANTSFVFDAWTRGDTFAGSDVWFRGKDSKFWAHSRLFTSQSTEGMTEVKTEAPSTPAPSTPAPPAEVTEPPYEFTPDFDFVEYKPANTWNMQDGNFPINPAKIVIHQFDAKDKKPSLDGVIGWFQTPRKDKPSSAHFGVSGDRIVQFVSLKDRAQHAGPTGNDYIGIEVDPQEDEKTVASVKKLIAALNKKYGKTFTYTKHRDVAGNNTECGVDIHLEKYALTSEKPTPKPEPTPTPKPEVPKDLVTEAEVLAKFLNWGLKEISDYLNKILKKYLDSQR